ncbi:hypothetical protein EMIT0210MI2_13513 [Priestia megaterium]
MNVMLMLLIIYTVHKGLEVIARTARRVFYDCISNRRIC